MKPLTTARPHAIILIGIPGSGKSTFAERFAETFQAPLINIRKLQQLSTLSLEQAAKIASLTVVEIQKTKKTYLLEGVGQRKQERLELIRQCTAAGYDPLFVWVQTDTREALRRARKPVGKGGSGMTEAEFEAATHRFQPPTTSEPIVVMSGKHTYATQLKVVLKQLATPRGPELKRPVSRSISVVNRDDTTR